MLDLTSAQWAWIIFLVLLTGFIGAGIGWIVEHFIVKHFLDKK